MSKFQRNENKAVSSTEQADDVRADSGETGGKFIQFLRSAWSWIYRLRGVILGVPVAVCAIVQAVMNMSQLPEMVGIGLQASGAFAVMLTRPVAALIPLTITVLCLLLMLCSRRVFYPWVISVFSLILPPFLLYSNVLLK